MSQSNDPKKQTGSEIAVIGMAGRFPGASDIYEYWDNLKNGVESIAFISDLEPGDPAITTGFHQEENFVKTCGGAIENKEYFDALFFNYTPLEATVMNPQMRMFHEYAWRTLEDAGYDSHTYTGAIGIYGGASSSFYWEGLTRLSGSCDELGLFDSNYFHDSDFMSTRIAYKLGLQGPAFTVQTACSTSLVAIHLACQGLLGGECDMALAGGAAIAAGNVAGYLFQEGMILSPDGHCRAFDARAKGTTGGNGLGIVLLKPLPEAIADGDHIYAVIKGTAINNDGVRKIGYTAPSIEGQAEVIDMALQMAETEPESIGYVETHGTGTFLGDPVEIQGLKLAFNTDKKGFCAIGSVKTNIGHLDTAAGIAGFIKTVLALKHRLIPPSLHFETPNPKIDFENSPFYVNHTLKEWKNKQYPLRAGVSSFGIGGTNAHVILEEAPGTGRRMTGGRKYHLVLLSAKTGTALDKMTKNLAEFLKKNFLNHDNHENPTNPRPTLADAAYTLHTGRRAFEHRRMLVCPGVEEAVGALSSPDSRTLRNSVVKEKKNSVVFMFPGLGSQYVNMGLDLYNTEPVFRSEMDRCFEIIAFLLGYDIKEVLYPSTDKNAGAVKAQSTSGDSKYSPDHFNRFDIAQLSVFIFEYALSQLLIQWGIMPQAMIGYSFGEISAACVAGVLSLEDALKMIVTRGKLIQAIPGGAMISVPLPIEEVKPFIFPGVSIAIDNGLSCIAAGSLASIAKFEEEMKKQRQVCMRLNTSTAVHSEMMDLILNEFTGSLNELKSNQPQIPYISNVTGTWMTDSDAKNPAYWKRHLRETVRFSDGIKELINTGNNIFIEIGPGRDISSLLGRYLENNPGKKIINLSRQSTQKVSDVFYLLNKIGILWLWGVEIDRVKFYAGEKRYRTPLPTYPFEGQRYWIDGDMVKLGTKIMKEKPQSPTSADMSDWFYIPSWKRLTGYPVSQKEEKNSHKYNWLVFVNHMNPGKLIADRLENEGHTVAIVKTGSVFERKNEKTYTVNPEKSGDYDTLLNELWGAKVVPDKIIHCWGLTGANYSYHGMKSFEEIQNHGFYSLLYLAKAIGKQDFINPIEIKVLTDNLHEVVGGEPLNPAKSTVLGLINSIPQEYPGIRCVNIDIPLPEPGTSEEEVLIDTLWEELTNHRHEPVVAIRNNNRWIQIFEPLHLEPGLKDYARLRENGVYLVTGGMGKIGLMFSELLARRVRARLVLTGRSQFPPTDEFKIKKVQQIEALGGQVLYIQADASSLEQMREVILRARQTFGMINGVIHCAGILKGPSIGLIQDLSPGDCKLQFQSKVYGAAVLDELLKNMEPDFTWMLSSISSFLGGLGFGAYAAANIFMDNLVKRRNRLQKKQHRWLSLNWDGMEAEKSIEIFERLFSLEKVDQIIFSQGGNLQERYEQWIKMERVEKKAQTPGERENKPKGHPRPFLTNDYVPPQNLEEKEITAAWERILGIDGIGVNDNFLELGGDSLKAITMLAALQKKMNVKVALAEIFKRPTIKELSEFIKKSTKEKYTAIKPVEKREYYLLSSAQKRIYFLQQLSLNSTVYNVSEVIPLAAEFEWRKIEDIFKKLIKRHEGLRTSFLMVNNTPVQRIQEDVEFSMDMHDYNDSQPFSSQDFIKQFARPFDLTKAPLIRAGLVKEGHHRPILIVDMHHIISDLISHRVLVEDFLAVYDEKEIPSLWLQYKDFSEWQNREIEKGNLKRQEEYWLKEFAGEIPVLEFPYDYPRPMVQSFEGDSVKFEVSEVETRALNAMALKEGATLFMVLAAVLNILLSKLSGQEEIIIGTPIVGRRHADLDKIIGIFINTLPLRNYPAGNRTFREFLGDVKEKMLQASENQEYPFEDIVDKLFVKRDIGRNPLFDVMFAFQNMKTGSPDQVKKTALETGRKVQPNSLKEYELDQTAKFDLTVLAEEYDSGLPLSFQYCTKLFKKETVKRFTHYFREILSIVVEEEGITISEIDIIPGEEKHRLLYEFNDTEADYPEDKTIHRLFEEQAERTSDNIALYGEPKDELQNANYKQIQLTYRALNEEASRLAGLLMEKGIQPDAIVGLMTERSIDMIIAILGILKSGGVYLPIDPEYPEDRIYYMLADTGARVLVTTGFLAKKGEKVRRWEGQRIFIEETPESQKNSIHHLAFQETCPENSSGIKNERSARRSYRGFLPSYLRNSSNPATGHRPPATSLAYIIYTSGTTGRPKGSLIEHRNVVSLMVHETHLFDFGSHDIWTMFHSYAFDFSVWEMYGALLYGGKLIVIPKMVSRDFTRFIEILEKQAVTVLNQTPSAFYYLSEEAAARPEKTLSIRTIIFGGEALNPAKLKQWHDMYPEAQLINMYGITETTVHVTYKEIEAKDTRTTRSNIGIPIPTLSIYVMDRNLRLLPTGVAGELCVGGKGVCRGYLNRVELTREKFVRNYYKTAERLYRTGDLGRLFDSSGEIEYLGRIDHQIKIRGFRIELGEIENCLLGVRGIKEAVVLAREENGGDKYICAYFVSDSQYGISELREYLEKELPDYMIPAYFVRLEKIPLNPNGKVDRGDMPDPVGISLAEDIGYTLPSSAVEKKLVEIWENVLGRDHIGINENFFMIGGDSIKSIQVISRMRSSGYTFEMKDLFLYPIISELAPRVKKLKRIPDQSGIVGTIPLTPIQKRFFNEYHIDSHHYNQAVMLYSREGFAKKILQEVFSKIQEHHDALRMTYKLNTANGEIVQISHDPAYPLSIQEYDLRNREHALKEFKVKLNEIQASIDLEKGPLMKLGLFHLEDGDRLLIALHHLVIDGVSWRILFEDIETLYNRYKRGEKLTLPAKTDSFKTWSEQLSEFANSKTFLKEKTYWQQVDSIEVAPIPKDFDVKENAVKDIETVSFTLDEAETGKLLTKVNETFKTEINDILITALGMGIKKTWGHKRVLIAMEGHGREGIFEDVDISRTVGWFTSLYPLLLDMSFFDNLGRQIKEIKETLRLIPHKGIGYGILKYLTNEENKKEIEFKLKPQISFNYLGQFDADIKQRSSFEIAGESAGNTHSLNNQREYLLDVSGIIVDKRLTMTISYNRTHFESGTAAVLSGNFKSELENLIAFCCSRVKTEPTPSDFTYKKLVIESVDRLMESYPGVEDIYTLTPLQEGMLFHTWADGSSHSYFEQRSYRLEGELDIRLIEISLKELSKRHEILRTVFVYQDIQRPVQMVLKEKTIEFYYEDLRKIDGQEEKENYIRDFKTRDKKRPFDLSKDALMRLSILGIDSRGLEFVWSFHHILMDGWCLGILNHEFFEIYSGYLENKPSRLPGVKPYRTYIQWLERQDKEESRRYWEKYLDSFEEHTGVPKTKIINKNDNRYKNENISLFLSREQTTGLNKLAVQNHVTMNTVTQVLWGILLGKYNGKEDVVFGTVVSGRPSELKGIESMVGLFINTIPVRIKFEEKMKFHELLQNVQEEALAGDPYHYHPLAEIQSMSTLKQNLIDHLFIFENYPIADQIEGLGREKNISNKISLKLANIEVFEQTNYDFNIVLGGTDRLSVSFQYNGNIYDRDFIEKISKHFTCAVDQVIENRELEVGELSLLLEHEEEQQLLKAIRPEVQAEFQKNGEEPGRFIDTLEAEFNF